jgi:hypothetical protein
VDQANELARSERRNKTVGERELPNRLVEPRVLITVRDEGHGRHVSYCGAS